MKLSLLLGAGLLGAAAPSLAAPFSHLEQRQVKKPSDLERRQSDNTTISEPLVPVLNVTYTSPANSSLPTVIIAATGGTIAGSSSSATDTTKYTAGVIGVEALVQAVPQLLNVSQIIGTQISNTASGNINSTILLRMAKLANQALCADNSTTDGFVITHGTDTLEESCYFMDATVNCGKPVVCVGAMRPSTAISADGPANLLEAVTLAASPSAKDRGAMVVLNDRIGSAYYTSKTQANTLDTFKAIDQGYLGSFLSNKPFFYNGPSQSTFKKTFDITNVTALPKVDILISHQEFDFELIPAAIAAGAKGIVIAGTGAGSTTTPAEPYIADAIAKGIPVVLSSKTNAGAVSPNGEGAIGAGVLVPTKARIQLQLAIGTGMNMTAIRDLFEADLAAFLA